jgi:copper chaperone CopZ
MKKLLIISILVMLVMQSNAQFTKATLQATGLTCAMCSNAINKALQKVGFVESVKSDIKNSAFAIVFKSNADVSIDALKDAVEDAGFSVGSLKVTGNFNDVKIAADQHVKIGNADFHFVEVASQTLNGENTITVVDKNFVSAKQFKKISSSTKMACVQTGKAAGCCTKDGVAADARVYHVTI